MLRFAFSAEVRQVTGVVLIGWLISAFLRDRVDAEMETFAWAVFVMGCAMVAPEIVQELVKAWKAWKGTNGA